MIPQYGKPKPSNYASDLRRKNSGDVSKRPSAVVRNELQTLEESHLQPKDIRNAALALYRERRKKQPTLPKCREDTHDVIDKIDILTNKG